MDQKQKEFVKRLKSNKKKKVITNLRWVVVITIMAFFISILFSFISESILPNVPVLIGVVVLVSFILIGVLFDMIGVAVTAADEKPFHSMSAKKVRGARVAITLKRNADKVGSFCNDVIGDICGIISGSAGVMVALALSESFGIEQVILSLLVTGLTAAFTIGGKALGKGVAIAKSNMILYECSKIISYFYNPKRS